VKGLAGLWRASRGAAREEEAVARRAMVLVMVSFILAETDVMVRSRCVGLCKRGLVVLNYLTRNVFCELGGSR
jgi:hypothetical protein